MEAWTRFLAELEIELGKDAVGRWLRPFKVIDYDAGNLYLEAVDTFQAIWFEKELRGITQKRFLNQKGRPIKIHITAPDAPKQEQEEAPLHREPEYTSDLLDPLSTLENFVTTPEHDLLFSFLKDLQPGAYNPLFLYGAEGSGKTHLLMAIGHLLKKRGLRVFFAHAQTFTQHVVSAIRISEMRPLRSAYRDCDVLIIDDVDQFARKNATQEELFHTFNALHSAGRQILLSSKYPPSRIEEIEPRLISRFEWGILFELPRPKPEQMGHILLRRAKQQNFPLSEELLAFLTETFASSTKALMRAFDALCLRLPKRTFSLTTDQAKDKLSDLIALEQTQAITFEKIVQDTAAYFGIRPQDILGKSQSKECTLPRQIAMYLCRDLLKEPYQQIGRHFERDHSTVMTSIRQIEKKRATDETVALCLKELKIRS